MTAPDVAEVFHDLVDLRFDPDHTGVSEHRATCGCGVPAWGPTQDAAKGAHREHRVEVAAAVVVAWAEAAAAIDQADALAAAEPFGRLGVMLGAWRGEP